MNKSTTRRLLTSTVLVSLALCMHMGARRLARPNIEITWRSFAHNLAEADYDDAYLAMSGSFRENHSSSAFQSIWTNCPWQWLITSNRDSTVVYLGLAAPWGGKATAFVTTSHMYLPLFLEDGFMGINIEMKKEGESWKLDRFPPMVVGR
ncbi:MAG: hypothetical protein K8T26_20675 [Lentisphaerae bacterium]|nr:hypothetical protein [Lentisphaerota bacterium]